MYRISGSIKLIAPFLYNKPSARVIGCVDAGTTGGRPTHEQKIAAAEDRVHTDGAGVLIIPQEMFKRSIVQGAKLANLKWGRRSLAQYLEAVLFVEGPLSFKTNEPDEIHEHWGKVPPRTGAMALLRRPMMKEGHVLAFSLVVFDDTITPGAVKSAIESAGLYSGVGAWRPQFGRFVLVDFHPLDTPKPAVEKTSRKR